MHAGGASNFLCPAHVVLRENGSGASVYFFGALPVCIAPSVENVCCAPRLLIIGGFALGLFEPEYWEDFFFGVLGIVFSYLGNAEK